MSDDKLLQKYKEIAYKLKQSLEVAQNELREKENKLNLLRSSDTNFAALYMEKDPTISALGKITVEDSIWVVVKTGIGDGLRVSCVPESSSNEQNVGDDFFLNPIEAMELRKSLADAQKESNRLKIRSNVLIQQRDAEIADLQSRLLNASITSPVSPPSIDNDHLDQISKLKIRIKELERENQQLRSQPHLDSNSNDKLKSIEEEYTAYRRRTVAQIQQSEEELNSVRDELSNVRMRLHALQISTKESSNNGKSDNSSTSAAPFDSKLFTSVDANKWQYLRRLIVKYFTSNEESVRMSIEKAIVTVAEIGGTDLLNIENSRSLRQQQQLSLGMVAETGASALSTIGGSIWNVASGIWGSPPNSVNSNGNIR